MEYRRSWPADYDAMVRLADANYVDNLTPGQRKDGFLTIRFVRNDFARMAAEIGIVVAIENNALAGFLCAEWIDKTGMPPVLATAARTFRTALFRGKPGSEWKAFLEGPLCIAAEHRGEGLRHGLHNALMDTVRGQFEVAVTFIAFDNARSYHGATAHGGEDEVGSFEVSGKRYHVLAFPVD